MNDQSPVYVIGHKNPDTDAICSALGYADFLRRTRLPNAEAACCGEFTKRTQWVLKQAGIKPPKVLLDVRPTALSVSRREVVKIRENETFLDVYFKMSGEGVRSLPAVDESNRLIGMVFLQDLLELILPSTTMGDHSARKVHTSLQSIAHLLRADLVLPAEGMEEERNYVLTISASSDAIVQERMNSFEKQSLIVVVGDRPEVHEMAITQGVRALVLTVGSSIRQELLVEARRKGVCVIRSSRDTATSAQLIRCSRSVSSAITRDVLGFHPHDLVSQIHKAVQTSNQPLFPVTDPETGELCGVFSKSDLLDPPQTRLVLVDHNEFSQAVLGAEDSEVIEVVDHHRLSGNLVTKEPIRFVNEPLGSTCTIVGRGFKEAGIIPERGIAICLCAGIVSDTLNLTSPTATRVDGEILHWLAEIAGIDVDEFTRGFFAAGSVLLSSSVEEALQADRKEFEENGWKLSISQVEELGLDAFWERRKSLEAELVKLVEKGLDFACLMVTDITRHYSLLLTAGSQRVVDKLPFPALDRSLFEMEGVVSRKKQVFPMLGRIVAGIEK